MTREDVAEILGPSPAAPVKPSREERVKAIIDSVAVPASAAVVLSYAMSGRGLKAMGAGAGVVAGDLVANSFASDDKKRRLMYQGIGGLLGYLVVK